MPEPLEILVTAKAEVQDAIDGIRKVQEELSNTGKGLATPAKLPDNENQKNPETDQEIAAVIRLENALKNLIAQKQAVGIATDEEAAKLKEVSASLNDYRKSVEVGLPSLRELLQVKAQLAASAAADEQQAAAQKSLANAMADAREKSTALAAARRAEMEAGQQAAVAAQAQETGRSKVALERATIETQEISRRKKLSEEIKANVADQQEETKGILDQITATYAMRRHFGAVLGQMIGVQGGGMLLAMGGIVAVIGGIALALEKAGEAIKEWFAQVDRMEEANQQFDTAGQHVKTLGELTRELGHKNDALAETYSHIADKFGEAEMRLKDLTHGLHESATAEDELAEATLKADLAEIKANNGLTAEQKAEATAAAEEKFEVAKHQRAIARKKEAADNERATASAIEGQRIAAANERDKLGEGLPAAQRKALIDAEAAKPLLKDKDENLALLNDFKKILQRFAEGKTGLGDYKDLAEIGRALFIKGFDFSAAKGGNENKIPLVEKAIIDEVEKKGKVGENASNSAAVVTALEKKMERLQARVDKFEEERLQHLHDAGIMDTDAARAAANEPAIDAETKRRRDADAQKKKNDAQEKHDREQAELNKKLRTFQDGKERKGFTPEQNEPGRQQIIRDFIQQHPGFKLDTGQLHSAIEQMGNSFQQSVSTLAAQVMAIKAGNDQRNAQMAGDNRAALATT